MIATVFADLLPSPPGLAGPLQPHIDWFAGRLAEHGDTHATAQEQLRLVAHLRHWLQEHPLGAEALDAPCIGSFLQDRRQQGRAPRHNRVTLQTFLTGLRDAGMLPVAVRQDSPLDMLACAVDHSLTAERGLAPITRGHDLPIRRGLLQERFGTAPLLLHTLGLHDVTQFLLRHASRVSPRRAHYLVRALRTFCRFLVHCAHRSMDLAAAIPRGADGRLATVPKAMAPAQVTRRLQSGDRTQPTGQRDDAIVLVLARLGLRPGEVVAMMREALDWEAGALLVRGTGGRRDWLPLPPDVGAALATSLTHVRPRGATRRGCVCMKAPQRGFAHSVAVCTIVRRALERAGLELPWKGAPILRHSLATSLLRAGASMEDISEVLRQRRPQTTDISAKVDQGARRALAQPWPGGAVCAPYTPP